MSGETSTMIGHDIVQIVGLIVMGIVVVAAIWSLSR